MGSARTLTARSKIMREEAQTATTLEPAIPFGQVRDALGFRSNRTLAKACARHGVEVLEFTSHSKALTRSAYELLLARAAGRRVK
jgi:hypothetical protein